MIESDRYVNPFAMIQTNPTPELLNRLRDGLNQYSVTGLALAIESIGWTWQIGCQLWNEFPVPPKGTPRADRHCDVFIWPHPSHTELPLGGPFAGKADDEWERAFGGYPAPDGIDDLGVALRGAFAAAIDTALRYWQDYHNELAEREENDQR